MGLRSNTSKLCAIVLVMATFTFMMLSFSMFSRLPVDHALPANTASVAVGEMHIQLTKEVQEDLNRLTNKYEQLQQQVQVLQSNIALQQQVSQLQQQLNGNGNANNNNNNVDNESSGDNFWETPKAVTKRSNPPADNHLYKQQPNFECTDFCKQKERYLDEMGKGVECITLAKRGTLGRYREDELDDIFIERYSTIGLTLKIEPLPEYLRSPMWISDGIVEDRSHLEFLGCFIDFSNVQRRVYIDWGSHIFKSSVSHFAERYPITFTEYRVVESVPNRYQYNDAIKKQFGTYLEKLIDFEETYVKADYAVQKLKSLNLKEDDLVVIKMDIEGFEWEVMEAIEQEGLHKYIDELLVEIHYGDDPRLTGSGWGAFAHDGWTKDRAKQLLLHWRNDLQVYAHYWP